MALPTYMLATVPQKTSGRSMIIKGPGLRPWIMRAPRRSAMMTFGGMPRLKSGMKPLVDAALLADSGPAMPSIAPLPNSFGCFENRFSAA